MTIESKILLIKHEGKIYRQPVCSSGCAQGDERSERLRKQSLDHCYGEGEWEIVGEEAPGEVAGHQISEIQ